MGRIADNSYRDVLLAAYGLEAWTVDDDRYPDRPETALKRGILRLKLPVYAMTEPAAEEHTDIRATIGTTTEVTDYVECDFGTLPAFIVKATPVVTRGTFTSTLAPTIDDVDVEISIDRGKNGTKTGREKNAASNIIQAVPMTALADVLLQMRVEAKETLGFRFRSRFWSSGSSGIAEAIIVGVVVHWNYAP